MGILNVKKGIICQQVNCMGVMGCGLALAIRNKWPIVYVSYKKQIHKAGLGKIQLVRVDDDLFVGNLFAQYRYGREKCHTNYQAMKTCLEKVSYWAEILNLNVYIPYKMGCGNAGGNWDTIENILYNTLPQATIISKDD